MSAELAHPRRKAATAASREEQVDEMIVDELRRHGPRTPAEMLVAIGATPSEIIGRTVALTTSGVLRITSDDKFTIRRRTR